MKIKIRFFLWTLFVLVVIAVFVAMVLRGLPIETDMTVLLPITEVDPVATQARRIFSKRVGGRTLFLVGSSKEATARQAAQQVTRALRETGLFSRLTFKFDPGPATHRLFFPFREQLLTPKTRALLHKNDNGKAFLRETMRLMYHPVHGAMTRYLKQDPLLLYGRRLRAMLTSPGKISLRGGLRMVRLDGMEYVLLTGSLNTSPYNRKTQRQLRQKLHRIRASLKQSYPDVQLRFAGMIRFAHYGAEASEREFSRIGIGTILGIVLLLLVTFGSLRPLLLSGLPIGVGLLCATTCLFFFFDHVHVLTLVFGGSLIGVCVDYSFHYFAEQRLASHQWTPMGGLYAILPGISLGAVTSILGYLALWIAPFPGLKQMAVFSSVGLLGAYCTVLLWFPLLIGSHRSTTIPVTLKFSNAFLASWDNPRYRRILWLFLGFCTVLAAVGISRLHTRDDIRLLYNQPKEILDDYKRIQAISGNVGVSRFFLVKGKTPDDVLSHEHLLQEQLQSLQKKGVLQHWMGLSSFLPTRQQQQDDHALLRKSLVTNGALRQWMKQLGFHQSVIRKTLARFQSSPRSYLTVQSWRKSPLSEPLSHLWLGKTKGGYASMVLLGGVTKSAALQDVARKTANLLYVDNVRTVSKIFRQYRLLISWLLLGVYLLIFVLLGWRYGLSQTFRMLFILLLTSGFTIGGLGLVGQSIDMFSMLALLLVLGIGIDYTIFFAEARTEQKATMLAILLSACTTILSFGLLALSQTPMLRTFGLTLLFGMLFALLLSPLARKTKQA